MNNGVHLVKEVHDAGQQQEGRLVLGHDVLNVGSNDDDDNG